MVSSLNDIPEEILYIIICYCTPHTSAALSRTARRLNNAVNEPSIWRYYCQTYFKFWDPKHDMQRRLGDPPSLVDWRGLFIARCHVDRTINNLLDSILQRQTGRIKKFRAAISLGYDIKDALLRHMSVGFEADDYLSRRYSPCGSLLRTYFLRLTYYHWIQRYYAKALLTCLHRRIAVQEWAKLRNGESLSLQRALGAFDLFIPESGFGNLDEVITKLDEIAAQILTCCPNINQYTPREKARTVASYLRASNLTGIQIGRDYHCLQHHFLGFALNDPEHNSLPLISAAIYCYIAQKVNLDARPCGFPFHVHVVVMPPIGRDIDGKVRDSTTNVEPIYMDPFRSEKEMPIENMQNQLNILGASTAEQSTFLGASTVADIVLRCGRNILNSVQHISQSPNSRGSAIDAVAAKYAALWSFLLFSTPSRPAELRHYLPWFMELFATDFPSDIDIIEQYIVPLFEGTLEYEHILESLHVMRAVDEIPKQIRRRTTKHLRVKYRIGQVFCHRRYNYTAIITGWDTECDAGEQWMRRMGIDRLQAGRQQSFYHVLAEDKTVRYVAEENVQILTPHLSDLPTALVETAGKQFSRWDDTRRRFVSNIRDEYPDD
ncbi:F-box domain protein [Aspergillus clavatus NRRL 1]|uniref:F-box domain protein n=1 Tax=Aspergillus clavatus (strain ATCC 1007 / CBS 513.65 / DSM 816 / NCTC 3887 / NRRL 1 / QM 1276 / 107) TaxID=344612 RepID=A1C5U6_ASPCL|nr:F-box domain protein [Aspergillus clavatus NRRL 1]EAW14650.1 F-box domain protein [Aspergillus clavatus NRRL 1]